MRRQGVEGAQRSAGLYRAHVQDVAAGACVDRAEFEALDVLARAREDALTFLRKSSRDLCYQISPRNMSHFVVQEVDQRLQIPLLHHDQEAMRPPDLQGNAILRGDEADVALPIAEVIPAGPALVEPIAQLLNLRVFGL